MAVMSDTESAFAKLTARFVENSFDRLDRLENVIDALANGEGDQDDNFLELKNDIHSLKGSAGTFGFQSVTTIAHRLEDYLENAGHTNDSNWDDVLVFVDQMRRILETGQEPSQEKQDQIYANLPIYVAKKQVNKSAKVRKALLVEKLGVMRMIASSELSNLGLDVSMASEPIEALEHALKIKPDVIFCSQQFDRITGLEFYKMLNVIEVTKKTPFALLTSDDTLKKRLSAHYSKLGVILKDEKFKHSVADYLKENDLLS